MLTLLTGSEYFPGGIGEFLVEQGSGLNFEYGPMEDLTLQWATYFDASDQASLSRLTGGIHPPADDFAGRRIGHVVGPEAWATGDELFLRPVRSRSRRVCSLWIWPLVVRVAAVARR